MLSHTMSIRVEWGDCDPARIVFYPRYFAWVDAAGHHMLEHGGLHYDTLVETYAIRGTVLGTVSMSFRTPSFFGDSLDITSRVTHVGSKSFKISHDIKRGSDLILTGEETRIWAIEDPSNPAGIVAGPLPEKVRAVLNGA